MSVTSKSEEEGLMEGAGMASTLGVVVDGIVVVGVVVDGAVEASCTWPSALAGCAAEARWWWWWW